MRPTEDDRASQAAQAVHHDPSCGKAVAAHSFALRLESGRSRALSLPIMMT